MALEIRLLGPIAAAFDGRPIALGARKQRAVLAMLALESGRTVSTDRLVQGLWGDEAPDTAPKMVQAYVSRLRKALPDGEALIVTHGRGYELSLAADSIDALRLERLVTDAADGSAREAIALFRGPPLVDVEDEPFAEPEIRRLEELWLRAKELSFDAQLAAGRHQDALNELGSLAERYPLRERLHWQRMLALYRSGRQADALAAYRDARRTLVDEVGVEPGRELQRLHEAILAQDTALDPTDSGEAPSRPTPPKAPAEQDPQPVPPQVPQHSRHRALFAAAAAAMIAGIAVFLVSRSGDEQRLPGIAEDTVAVLGHDGKHLRDDYAVGRRPVALTAGAGYVWAANELDGTVTRIDPRTGGDLTIEVGGDPVKLTFGGGSVWVSDGTGRTVTQVNPDDARIVQRIEVGGGPRGVAVGGGALWVATALDGAVQRVDLAKGRVTQHIPVASTPTDLAFGAGGLWVASETGGTVLRIEPDSGRVLDSVNVGNGPASIAIGAGAVWVANRQDNTLTRIDPATATVTGTVPVGRGPVAVAVGAGVVWTANADDGTISRVDAATRRATDQIEVGSTPAALLPVGDDIWVSGLPSRASHRGGTLRVRLLRLPDGCRCADPIGYDGAVWSVVSVAYDGLLAYRRTAGAAGGTLVGALATGVPRPTNQGRTYAFRLRPGLRYSDGRAVRAEDVRASLERLLEVHAAAPGGYDLPDYFSALPGAAACIRAATPCDLSKAIDVDEQARVVTFHLVRPDAELPHKLALPLAAVLPADTPRRIIKGTPPPGTGPYRFVRFDGWRGGQLERNAYFRSWSEDARPDGFADVMAVTSHRRMPTATSRRWSTAMPMSWTF